MNVNGHYLRFTYDASGTPLTVRHDGFLYYYITNIQGDVIAIVDTTGTPVVNYTYDAWGNILSATGTQATAIGRYNPLRYRGYVYDTETGLYYLQSRYYNPKVGRFINADGYVATGQGVLSNNMFAYCLNNPINNIDTTGTQTKDVWYFHQQMKNDTYWYQNIFGASAYTTYSFVEEQQIIPDPLPVTLTVGTKTTQTITEYGDASNPLSVYAEGSMDNLVGSSSVGVRLNVSDFSLDIGLALDDIGITGSITEGTKTTSFGITANLTSFKIGITGETSISWDNVSEASYWNLSISGWTIIFLYCWLTTGQPVPAPSTAPAY